ncbi:endonuclease/exonuclease/phosphatase family protein [Rhodospirillum sp. A1_3_36]|uniref:endonuclease/exonuclease/phosphatase family protein n=1 Tax=Rhodospirillum sp. A1_3_36 TaxID=3391666 RepID=UPI0039A635F1
MGSTEPEENRDPKRLSLATYNIHSCLGTDGKFRPDRIVRVLQSLDVDVLGLQEVGWALRGRVGFDQFAFLERETGLTVLPGLVRHHADAHFGNAILTRHPVEAAEGFDLGLPYHSPRGGVEARLLVGGRLARVINVHLGLNPVERRLQIQRLLYRLAEEPDLPTLLCGDMNHWRRTSYSMGRLRVLLPEGVVGRTYPSGLPTLMFDRILGSTHLSLESHRVVLTDGTRVASDHLPLEAHFSFRASP